MANSKIPRPIRRWTALKLEYLDHYLQAYVTATKRRGAETYYIDAFSGPGDCILQETGLEIPGSPWRAVSTVPPFGHYYFIEMNPRCASHLRQRLFKSSIAQHKVYTGDCNNVIPKEVLPKLPKDAPGFAFLDPTGLQVHWRTVEMLAAHRTQSRWKMELLILYPYHMSIDMRLFNATARNALTRFFGDETWMNEFRESQALEENRDQRATRFLRFYIGKLKSLQYRYVNHYGPLSDGPRPLYHVLFAGDHPVGAKIMSDVWSKDRAIPGQLDYTPVKRPRPR